MKYEPKYEAEKYLIGSETKIMEKARMKKVNKLIKERSCLDSILKCTLRYCNEHSLADSDVQKKMRSMIHKLMTKYEKRLIKLTGKDYWKLLDKTMDNELQ